MASGIHSLIDNVDTPESSADQDAWLALSGKLMDQLGKMIPMMEVMKNITDACQLVEATWTALLIHKHALTLDKYVEIERAKHFPE